MLYYDRIDVSEGIDHWYYQVKSLNFNQMSAINPITY